jgi:hypothetical protein
MPRIKTSPHYQFAQPLLQAMYDLTGGQANVKINHKAATEATCKLMGLSLDSNGSQPATGQFWNVRWTSLAMLDHRKDGLMDYPVKGQWVLTPKGVSKLSGSVVASALAAIDEAEKVIEATKPARVAKAVAAPVAAPVVETPAPLAIDPDMLETPTEDGAAADHYLLSLQLKDATCFGYWTPKSEACKACPLATRCADAKHAVLAKLAAKLAADAKTAKAVAPAAPAVPAAPAPTTATPVVPMPLYTGATTTEAPTTATAPKATAPATVAVKTATPTNHHFVEVPVIAAIRCSVCSTMINADEVAAYAKTAGFVHKHCTGNAK